MIIMTKTDCVIMIICYVCETPGDSNTVFFSFTLSQTHHDREMLNKLSVIICCERLRQYY